MTSPINSASLFGTTGSSSTNSSTTSSATGGSQALGQDAFLKLLMAQLQNQDPTQPADGTEFVTQLSQFSMVEQSVQQSTQLGNIATQLQGLQNQSATALVGKMVTVQNTGMTWNGSFAPTATVGLAAPAQSVSVQVQDSSGNTVRTMTLGQQAAGALAITWDGKQDSGQVAPNGSYSVNVTATAANGQSVGVSQTVSGQVTQVSLQNGTPTMTLNNGAVAPLSQLVTVSAVSAASSATGSNTTAQK